MLTDVGTGAFDLKAAKGPHFLYMRISINRFCLDLQISN